MLLEGYFRFKDSRKNSKFYRRPNDKKIKGWENTGFGCESSRSAYSDSSARPGVVERQEQSGKALWALQGSSESARGPP